MILEIKKEMKKLANPQKAKILAGFFKTGKGQYGEGDKFLGITVPQTRALVKKYWQMPIVETLQLFQSQFHEERLFALLILVRKYEKGDQEMQEKIFKLYLKNAKQINSWDLVDLTADRIVGNYLEGKSKEILFKLAGSKILWERRIAMLATFHEIKNGRSEMTLALAEKLLNDQEDLMHKAVGWMLREVGKRCSQEDEEIFLKKYVKIMPRTMLRYAIERFEEGKRQGYLRL
jgi:3-methyladenine DNA glycosylase AlkD